MGVSVPMMSPQWKDGLKNKGLESTHEVEAMLVRSFSFDGMEANGTSRSDSFRDRGSKSKVISDGSHKIVLGKSLSFKNWEAEESKVETTVPFRSQDKEMKKEKPVPRPSLKTHDNFGALTLKPPVYFHEFVSPKPKSELDAAAVKLQKVYKSYRTRRNLADCAVVVEELWWKALDFAALKRSSVSFFSIEKPETAVSRWTRARTRVARVGKGLSKDEKAQKLALQHWLEAIDPRHRYGHNLHFYYDVWFHSESTQPFFYWLDVGDGREVNLDKCPRCDLQRQWIAYLGPKERESFEVIVENGKLVYKESGLLVDTVGGYKWIFVLSTSRTLYVGQKKKGKFQHSSFLSGGATSAAGRMVAESGVLKAIWPYSGHYLPTEEHFKEFLSFLEDNHVDLSNVKRCADDDDSSSFVAIDKEPQKEITKLPASTEEGASSNMFKVVESVIENTRKVEDEVLKDKMSNVDASSFQSGKPLSCKWSTGAGPRIGCVRDYPSDLQCMALEKVNLSPRLLSTPFNSSGPIPSPRPSPKVRLSPRLSYMGLPSPRMAIPQSAN